MVIFWHKTLTGDSKGILQHLHLILQLIYSSPFWQGVISPAKRLTVFWFRFLSLLVNQLNPNERAGVSSVWEPDVTTRSQRRCCGAL